MSGAADHETQPARIAAGVAIGVVVAALYYVAGRIGLAFVARPEGVAAFWPPSGVLLAALLVTARHRWPAILALAFAAILLANSASGHSAPTAVGFALANCAEGLLAASVLVRVLGGAPRLDHVRHVCVFVIGAAGLSNALTALLGASVAEVTTGASWASAWSVWWIADGVGMLVVTPLALAAVQLRPAEWPGRRRLEALVLLGALLIASLGVFSAPKGDWSLVLGHPYLLVLLLVAAAVRLGPPGAAVGTGVVAGAAVWAIRGGTASSALLFPGAPHETLLAAQLFVAAAAVTALVVAALYAERIRAEASLAESQASLARDVAQRTRAEGELLRQVISERKAKDSLRASEESLRRSQEIANLGDWAWDTRTNRVRWSDQMYRIFGIDRACLPEDIDLAEVIRRAIHPDDRDAVLAANETVVREGRPVEMEYRVVRADGTLRVVRATPGGARTDEQGQVVELWGVVQDVTESRLAERQLEESRRLLLGITETIPDVVYLYDTRERRHVYFNREMASLLGYSDEQIKAAGSDLLQGAVHPEDLPRVEGHIAGMAHRADDGVGQVEYRIRAEAGDYRWLFVRERVFQRDAASRPELLFGVCQDITERKQAEQEALRLKEQFLDAQKMEAVGTLAAGIAHDFNNILTPVMAHAELALLETPEDSPVRADLGEIHVAAARAASLVRQILDLSRREQEPVATIALAPLVKEVARFLRASLPTTIELRTTIAPGCGPVRGSLSRLHQVLLNLGTNAADAMQDKGGLLGISLERAPGQRVRLAVSDTGTGIPPEIAEHIFEPYFTTKARGKGTGLGLATVRSIVTSMGGEVSVSSEPERGTTFEVWLPEVERDATPASGVRHVRLGRGQHLLVVDDEPAIVKSVESMAVALGYGTSACGTPAEALAAFRADPARFAAVFTDQTMPGMTGLELAREILRMRPGLPVLLGTGYADEGVEAAARAFGIRSLLLKPYSLQTLGEALERALGAAVPRGERAP